MAIIVWVSTVVIIDPTDLCLVDPSSVTFCCDEMLSHAEPKWLQHLWRGLKHVENKWMMFSGKSIYKCLDFFRDTPPF